MHHAERLRILPWYLRPRHAARVELADENGRIVMNTADIQRATCVLLQLLAVQHEAKRLTIAFKGLWIDALFARQCRGQVVPDRRVASWHQSIDACAFERCDGARYIGQ